MTIVIGPFRDMMALHDRVNRLFDASLNREEGRDEDVERPTWTPAVDIYETQDSIVVNVEAAGIAKERFAVEVKEDVLTIRGERPFEKDVSREQYHRVERNYGRFRRSFILGVPVKVDRISAAYRDGVLEIVLPKVEEAKPRKIQITE